jgi:hypothetical protein
VIKRESEITVLEASPPRSICGATRKKAVASGVE